MNLQIKMLKAQQKFELTGVSYKMYFDVTLALYYSYLKKNMPSNKRAAVVNT